MADFLIVGGGLIGLLTARELALGGATVHLVERDDVGRASSWAGGGILSPLHPWRYPDAVTELARWSQGVYRDLCDVLRMETGTDPEWTRSGLLMLGVDDGDRADAWGGRFGRTPAHLGASQCREIEPALAPDACGSDNLWLADVAQVRNPRLVTALRQDLVRRGVRVTTHCPVRSLRVSGGKIMGIETEKGPIPGGAVVVAGGAWSGRLLQTLGANLPIRPVRGQMLLFRAAPGTLDRIVLSDSRYIIPRRDGHVLVGSTMEHVGFDTDTTAEARRDMEGDAVRLIPALGGVPVVRHWAGLRPGSPGGIPFITEHPDIRGLFVNAGQFRNGVVTGPASARLLADLAFSRAPVLDPYPYSWIAERDT